MALFRLPIEVIFMILSKLPTKTLIQFRCAAKSCSSLISHPDFIKLHFSARGDAAETPYLLLYYESIDYTGATYSLRCAATLQESLPLELTCRSINGYLRIVGSSRGLICFFDTNYYAFIGRVIFWNPSLEKFKILPACDLFHRFSNTHSHTVVGFGFVLGIGDFKVVKILFDDDLEKGDVLVYSLVSDSWRKVETEVPCFMPKCWWSNVFVNGFVNWLAYKKGKVNTMRPFDRILGFDMSNEVFKVIEFPKHVDAGYHYNCLCSSMNEERLCLGFHYLNRVHGTARWDIWVMREYGIAASWKRSFRVAKPDVVPPPLSVRGDAEVLLVMKGGKLVLCDAAREHTKDLDICGLGTSFCVVNYTPSLALLGCSGRSSISRDSGLPFSLLRYMSTVSFQARL